MPVYKPLEATPENIKFEFPSTPAGEIWGPGALRWGLSKRIDMQSSRMDPVLGEYQQSTAFQDALLMQWITHPATDWNLLDANNQKLPRDPNTIDEILTPEDIEGLSLFLTKHLYPPLYERLTAASALLSGGSADPNATTTDEPSNESDGDETTNVSPGSDPTATETPPSKS